MVLFIAAIALGQAAQQGGAPAQTPETFSHTIQVQVQANYLLYLPSDYAQNPHKRYPLVLFLHGAGERGSDINAIKKHGFPKEIEQGKQYPFIVVSPQCQDGGWWANQVPELIALMDEAEKRYRVDRDREYVTGISMGGYGTYALAAAQPKRFAAIAPISGGADPSIAPKIKDIPIWATHGAKDSIVNISQEQPLIDALKGLGADVRFDIIPDGEHDVVTPVYASDDLYKWLLQHKRKH